MELKPATIGLSYTRCRLLIVPYGIETGFIRESLQGKESFNRTLWN